MKLMAGSYLLQDASSTVVRLQRRHGDGRCLLQAHFRGFLSACQAGTRAGSAGRVDRHRAAIHLQAGYGPRLERLGLSLVPHAVANSNSKVENETSCSSGRHMSAASTSGQGQSGGAGSRSARISPRRARMKLRTRSASAAAAARAAGGACVRTTAASSSTRRRSLSFLPDRVQQVPEAVGVGRAAGWIAVDAVGQSAVRVHRRRRLEGVEGYVVGGEHRVHAPRDEHEARVRFPVEVVVVAVAATSVRPTAWCRGGHRAVFLPVVAIVPSTGRSFCHLP